MKEFMVSYMLGDMYHCNTYIANNKGELYKKIVNSLYEGSLARLSDLRVETIKEYEKRVFNR